MKKVLIIASIFAGILFAACSKTSNNDLPDNGKSSFPTNLSKISSTSDSIGDAHTVLRTWVPAHYGHIDTTTYQQATHYVEGYNVNYGTSLNVSTYASDMVDYMKSAGAYDNDGVPVSGFSQKMIGSMPASDLKDALMDIVNSTDTGATFKTYVHTRLTMLTGLSPTDALLRDGFESVLGSSYQIMEPMGLPAPRPYSSLTKKEKDEIAKSDASGFVIGYMFGGLLGGKIMSALASGDKTQEILGGTWIH